MEYTTNSRERSHAHRLRRKTRTGPDARRARFRLQSREGAAGACGIKRRRFPASTAWRRRRFYHSTRSRRASSPTLPPRGRSSRAPSRTPPPSPTSGADTARPFYSTRSEPVCHASTEGRTGGETPPPTRRAETRPKRPPRTLRRPRRSGTSATGASWRRPPP